MSWGERSCIHYGRGTCPIAGGPTLGCCNVNCGAYKHDGKTKPDSQRRPGLLSALRDTRPSLTVDEVRRVMRRHGNI